MKQSGCIESVNSFWIFKDCCLSLIRFSANFFISDWVSDIEDADKINEKYKCYISIKGIPEDEVDEFTNLHTAYKGVGGNHSGDAKYEYCMNHLEVIPVKTKLLMDSENNH